MKETIYNPWSITNFLASESKELQLYWLNTDVSKLGYVIEFKKTRKNETVESAVESALKQIEDKKYEIELIERGIANIKKLAIVFSGKEVFVKEKK